MGSGAVIILDTHVWIWWVHGDAALPGAYRVCVDAAERADGIGVCPISCWEVAKLVEVRRLTLPFPVAGWLQLALSYPGVQLLEFSPRVCVESTQLPGTFHRDPADQIIVATARVLDCPQVTLDGKIRAYPHVRLAP